MPIGRYPRNLPPQYRFWMKVQIREDCWIWTGAKYLNGYGNFWHKGKAVLAHRYVYDLLIGEIPLGMDLDHVCSVRDCVNPAHLRPATPKENRGQANRRKGFCPREHPYDMIEKDGGRGCRKCKNKYQRLHMVRKKARAAGLKVSDGPLL
jgi:hypothetical protein